MAAPVKHAPNNNWMITLAPAAVPSAKAPTDAKRAASHASSHDLPASTASASSAA